VTRVTSYAPLMALRLVPLALAAALLTLGPAAPSVATSPASPGSPASPVRSAQQTAAAPTRVLVLGDSYSAGNGAGDYYGPSACRRSREDYGHQFGALETAAGHPTRVTVGACSGAVTHSYWSSQESGVPAQKTYVDRSYDTVMLTLGGNDAAFSTLVQTCLLAGPGLNTTDPTRCDQALTHAQAMVPTIGKRLTAVLANIEHRASRNARIVLIGYPYLESDTSLMVGDVHAGARLRTLQQDADTMERGVVRSLNRTHANRPFVWVPTSPLYDGTASWLPTADRVDHELSSTGDAANEPNPNRWITAPFIDAGLTGIADFYHPLPAGWTAEAQLLAHDAAVPDGFGSGPAWSRVVVGTDRVCGVRAGTDWCWGGGHSDPRRTRTLPAVRPRPATAPAGTRWSSLSTSGATTCGVEPDGSGWCWGSNRFGQLGVATALGTRRVVTHPVRISGHHVWRSIVVGAHQACGILASGRHLVCWGADRRGALGRAVTSGEHHGAVTPPAAIRMPAYDGTSA
jgi:lysophospholipase L1-like esterase